MLNIKASFEMPMRMLDCVAIRSRIAHEAANMSGLPASHYLDLLGDVEPEPSTGSWILRGYFGSFADIEAIQKAETAVRRRHPLARSSAIR